MADNYLELALQLAKELTRERLEIAIELARYPDAIRGYGPVKEAAMAEAEKRKQQLLARFQAPRTAVPAAA